MLLLDKNSKTPLYTQIYSQLKDKIVSGEMEEGTMLPSTRILAKTMLVGRNTVESAYQQLCSEGYVKNKIGSGYKVQSIGTGTDNRSHINRHDFKEPTSSEQIHEQGISKLPKYNFQYGRLDIANFPLRIWRRLLNQVLLSDETACLTAYNDRNGDWDLRIQILKYLNESRGVVCKPEQIIIGSGAMSCLGLICQLLMPHINLAAVEDPCYDSVREIFSNHGYHVAPISLQEDGVNLDQLELSQAKVLYTTPSHQFPTGIVMPINKRLNLIEWAEKNNAYIIEDDYDSELRYNCRPIPSIHSLDKKGRVIYLNSFSKTFAPSLRMGFLVLPEVLLENYQSNFSKYNCSVSWLEQRAMYKFIQQGHWNRHLNKICLSSKKKHDTLISSINELMKDRVIIYGKNAGLHILLKVNNGMTEKELIESAKKVNVKVYSVSEYWLNLQSYSNNMVLIGFSSLSEEEIISGIRLLSSVWFRSADNCERQ
ncbi:transcription regulator hth gntr [Lucifera butyrica]|uniref:Transcription regulator hth gntr n=1 Tax=Lucifera butyrica TaxID=1351585 RepID=A0A498R3F5_9FIRM|nr:PLP-dependent aminotransferase family protein [Lucifera butyrica]VBB05695.1 transcription regulator hth gntr [Lucifera butyrica]